MQMKSRVIVYIDGYNLYYSRLRGTPYKWLDLVTLFQHEILNPQLPGCELIAVKYFTAPAMARFASHGKASEAAQTQYHRALKAQWPALIDIVLGYHVVSTPRMMRYVEPPDKEDRVAVWLLEEKQTDVNIALTLYRDVVTQLADTYVVCSNDSDLIPALKAIKQDFTSVKIGLVAPLPEPTANLARYPNKALLDLSDWSRSYLRNDELLRSQLPDSVPTKKKAACKPSHWFSDSRL